MIDHPSGRAGELRYGPRTQNLDTGDRQRAPNARHCSLTRSGERCARPARRTRISDIYNTCGRHSKASGLPPVEFEHAMREARKTDQARYRQ